MSIPNDNYQVNFEYTIEKYSDMVYRIAMTITGNEEDAKDVFQETFLRLVRNKHKITNEEHLKAWLIRVAGNCSKTVAASPWNKHTQGINDEIQNNKEVTGEKEKQELFYEIKELGEKYAIPLYLFYYEEYSINEISKILGKNENSIKTLLSRGRKLLAKKLKEEGYHFG